MKPLIVTVLCFGFFLAACSGEENGTAGLVSETSSIATSTTSTIGSEPTIVVEPTQAVVCPEVTNPHEQTLRNALSKEGNFIGQTVSVRIEGCDLRGHLDYSRILAYAKMHPEERDPKAFPLFPDRELIGWLSDLSLDQDLYRKVQINWSYDCSVVDKGECSHLIPDPTTLRTTSMCAVLSEELHCY